MKTLFVRADASPEIGYGHLRRCLEVARALGSRAQGVSLLTREGSDARLAERAGVSVVRIEGDRPEDWQGRLDPQAGPLLLDTYTTSEADLVALRGAGRCVAVFDDGARLQRYDADVVIDYGPAANESQYAANPDTRWCLGPAFFPLRPEFVRARRSTPIRNRVTRIAITFGGSDPDDWTSRVLETLERGPALCGIELCVILGPGHAGRRASEAAPRPNVELVRDPADLAERLAGVDLAISGAGGTALELAFLGIPSILIPISADQVAIARALGEYGAAVDLGDAGALDDERLDGAVAELVASTERRAELAERARQRVDGRGAERLANALERAWESRS